MRHTVTMNIRTYLDKHSFSDIDSTADHIIEYWPDFNGPSDADSDTIVFEEVTYNTTGTEITFVFEYDEVEEEEDEDEVEEDEASDEDEG